MKILVASTPAEGQLNPLLGITRVLLEGHEIAFLTGSAFRDRIERSGAKFICVVLANRQPFSNPALLADM
jgi:UDP:flavonoid glycosyltransferase YjiC (YdhE family)